MAQYANDKISLEKNIRIVFDRCIPIASPEAKLINPALLKKAYFKKAKKTHPDLAASIGIDTKTLHANFQALRDAYDYLLESWNSGKFLTLLSNFEKDSRRKQSTKMPPSFTTQSKKIYTWMPQRELRIGEYLVHSGKIDFLTLLAALRWQVGQRPRIGAIAQSMGILTRANIISILNNRKQGELFAEAALRLGLIERKEFLVLNGRQRLLNMPLGKYFVDNGHLSQEELKEALEALHRYNYKIKYQY